MKTEERHTEDNQIKKKYGTTLILWNDDFNTLDFVISKLMEVCGHSSSQAEQCAMIAHFNGKIDIKQGIYPELKDMKDKLIAYNLTVTIE